MIRVQNLWTDRAWDLPDDEAFWQWAQAHVPQVMLHHPKTTDDLLALVNAQQNYTAMRQGAPEVDVPPAVSGLFRAAAILRRGLDLGAPGHRAAAVLFEDDPELAALAAAGVSPTDENRTALRGLATAGELGKAEHKIGAVMDGEVGFGAFDQPEPLPDDVVAVVPDGEAFADKVRQGIQDGRAKLAHLDGKHSKGSWLVACADGTTIFLKPGSGAQSPAGGVREQSASQPAREAAFYAALKVFGLEAWAPEAHLLEIGGKEYAALAWLGDGWDEAKEVYRADSQAVTRALYGWLSDGTLHRLAAAEFSLGNTDVHGGNVLFKDGQFRLIDAGGALAGDAFDPQDRYTFLPWFLRIFTGASDFQTLPPEERYIRMPVLPQGPAEALGAWLAGVSGTKLAMALDAYGVMWEPIVRRLGLLQMTVARGGLRADAAVNQAWTIGLQ